MLSIDMKYYCIFAMNEHLHLFMYSIASALFRLSSGTNPETGQATVGFRLASYKTGSMCVAPVSHLKNIPQKMKDVVEVRLKIFFQNSL